MGPEWLIANYIDPEKAEGPGPLPPPTIHLLPDCLRALKSRLDIFFLTNIMTLCLDKNLKRKKTLGEEKDHILANDIHTKRKCDIKAKFGLKKANFLAQPNSCSWSQNAAPPPAFWGLTLKLKT